MDRRKLLKALAIGGAGATLAACDKKEIPAYAFP